VSLKSRTSSCRRRENDKDVYCPTEAPPFDVVDVAAGGPSTLSGKYALYRPRPGRNVNPATTLTGTDDDGQDILKNKDNAGDIYRPSSEMTFVYENNDKASVCPSGCRSPKVFTPTIR